MRKSDGGDILYLSYSANRHKDPDWWVVEPRDDGPRQRRQLDSLLRVGGGKGRRVIQLVIHPRGAEAYEVFSDTADIMLNHLDPA